MMKSEFIERTGFEPTENEYAEIEAEYMGCDIDKDQFCKEWKKNGGIQRMMRMRARRIEELEAQIAMKDKQYDEMDTNYCVRINELAKDKKIAESNNETYRYNQKVLENALFEANTRAAEAERKIKVLQEAFAILGVRKEA